MRHGFRGRGRRDGRRRAPRAPRPPWWKPLRSARASPCSRPYPAHRFGESPDALARPFPRAGVDFNARCAPLAWWWRSMRYLSPPRLVPFGPRRKGEVMARIPAFWYEGNYHPMAVNPGYLLDVNEEGEAIF